MGQRCDRNASEERDEGDERLVGQEEEELAECL